MSFINIDQCTKILELFGDNIKFTPNSKSKHEDDENNNDSSVSFNNNSDSFVYPTSYSCYVILDTDAEDILQKLTDEFFQQCFHFDKVIVRCLLMELHQRTHYHPLNDVKEGGLSFDLSVLVTLSFLLNGNFDLLLILRPFTLCSQNVFRKAVQKICTTIVYFLSPDYVRFPSSQEEQQINKSEFERQFGVPGVVGVMDYYHVGLEIVPDHEKHMYINRHFKSPSLAVQVICDHNYRFLDINPRFSGSTYNIHIWQRSHISGILQSSQKISPNTWLVADRGYHLSSCVINPYRNTTNMLQESVNVALKEVQIVALKSFALLKARFRCLDTVLPFNHKNASNIITACATLHNYLLTKECPIEDKLEYKVPKGKNLPNAQQEDVFSPEGVANREYIKDFMYNNSMQALYKLRTESYFSCFRNIDQVNNINPSVD